MRGQYSQRLQTLNAKLRRQQTRQERQHGAPRLPDAADPANTPGKEPLGEDVARLLDEDGVHGAEEEADAGDGERVFEEGGDDPDCYFESGGRKCVNGEAIEGRVIVTYWIARKA